MKPMTDRPILFSAPMVRALLDGRKTQTRRALGHFDVFTDSDGEKAKVSCLQIEGEALPRVTIGRVVTLKKLKATVGDRLWVRESHAIVPRTAYRMSEGVQQTLRPDDNHDAAVYAADWDRSKPGQWRPSIHMPRWASRLTLTVTAVRVERLQDISDRGQPNDCIAEGVFSSDFLGTSPDWMERGFSSVEKCRYHDLWNAINGPGSWEANPWVAAYTFTVERKNIDEVRP